MERALPLKALVLTPGLIVGYDALGPEGTATPTGPGGVNRSAWALPVVCLSALARLGWAGSLKRMM
jgi:hypothetical protein